MVQLIVDRDVRDLLLQANERAEIRGVQGQLLGYFEPHQETEAEMYEHAKKLFDPAEVERRKAAEKDDGLTFAQVLDHLRALEAKEKSEGRSNPLS